MRLHEHLLHYIWQGLRFSLADLRTTRGEAVTLLEPGRPNPNAGPDFLDARLRMQELEWVGAVEIHWHADDWYQHGHHQDPRYNATLLHVVYTASQRPTQRTDGTEIPQLSLEGRLQRPLLELADRFANSSHPLACSGLIHQVDSYRLDSWLQRQGWERILGKAEELQTLWNEVGRNWEELCWRSLARAFGAPVNQEAFVQLAQTVPVRALQKVHADPNALESLLLGAAGFWLEAPEDDTEAAQRQRSWRHYQHKYNLRQLDPGLFRFLRMRPSNFPTVRLAQLAALLHHFPRLTTLLEDPRQVFQTSEPLAPTPYWLTHYRPAKTSNKRRKSVGEQFLIHLLINSLIPLSVFYHQQQNRAEGLERLMELMHELPAEANKYTRVFAEVEVRATDALESQGMLQLFRTHCQPRRCLQCQIGYSILKLRSKPDQ